MFPHSASLSFAVGLLASILGMAVYSTASPFADDQDSWLMLPAQLQVTITLICGMLMEIAEGNQLAELAISLFIILSFLPVMALGFYLLWDPDFDVVSYFAGATVSKLLAPFLTHLPQSKGSVRNPDKTSQKDIRHAVKLAVELVMNPNLDATEDIKRLAGPKHGELVAVLVQTVRPLVETGTPDAEDVLGMLEALLEACSGEMARCSGPVVEMVAIKALALTGVPNTHPVVNQVRRAVKKIGSPGSKFRSLSDCYEVILPVIQGDVSEEEVMHILEEFGLSRQTVAQALLPPLCGKALSLAGIDAPNAHSALKRVATDMASWNETQFASVGAAVADCFDGDISQGNLEQLLSVIGVDQQEAVAMAAAQVLRKALASAMPGRGAKGVIKRVMLKVTDALARTAADSALSYDDVCRLCVACADERHRDAAILELVGLVGESTRELIEPAVLKALVHVGLRSDSAVMKAAGRGAARIFSSIEPAMLKDLSTALVHGSSAGSGLDSATQALQHVLASCAQLCEHGPEVDDAETLLSLLDVLGVDKTTAQSAVMEVALGRAWALLGIDEDSSVFKVVTASMERELRDATAAQLHVKFEKICAAAGALAQSASGGSAEAVLRGVFSLLGEFGVSQTEATTGVLSSVLAKVLSGLEIESSHVVALCCRSVGSFARTGDIFANGACRALISAALAQAHPNPDAPFTISQALSLLSALGVPDDDALLAVTGSVFLTRALETAGVPQFHSFQRQVHNAVGSLADRNEPERSKLAQQLRRAIDAKVGPLSTCSLVRVLDQLPVDEHACATVMAPLLVTSLLKRAGVCEGHVFLSQALREARATTVNCRTIEEVGGDAACCS
jgi:hypothetical protein